MAKRKAPAVPPRLVLSFDPGSSAGVALFLDGQYVGSKACGGAFFTTLSEAVLFLTNQVTGFVDFTHDEKICVVEDGFGRGIGSKTLDRRRGLCAAAAEHSWFANVEYVYPGTWHSAMFKSRESAAMKAEAMQWCRDNLGFTPDTHDQAEACVLGWWYANKKAA